MAEERETDGMRVKREFDTLFQHKKIIIQKEKKEKKNKNKTENSD